MERKIFNLILVILLISVLILLIISCKHNPSVQYANDPLENTDELLKKDPEENKVYKPPEDQSKALLPNEWEDIGNLPEIPVSQRVTTSDGQECQIVVYGAQRVPTRRGLLTVVKGGERKKTRP